MIKIGDLRWKKFHNSPLSWWIKEKRAVRSLVEETTITTSFCFPFTLTNNIRPLSLCLVPRWEPINVRLRVFTVTFPFWNVFGCLFQKLFSLANSIMGEATNPSFCGEPQNQFTIYCSCQWNNPVSSFLTLFVITLLTFMILCSREED